MIYHSFWGSHYATILFKYLSQMVHTLFVLISNRPKYIFVMAPPVAAVLPVWLYARFTRARFIIDAHTAAFADRRWQLLQFIQRFFSRRALSTLVTNGHWRDLVESWRARSDIVPDVPVLFPVPSYSELPEAPNILVVCTYTYDEPISELLDAARLVPEVHFHFTGDFRRLDARVRGGKPDNVTFTGFLRADKYAGMLMRCTAVMCVTTVDHTMQRGAYEAAYLGRPIITSNFDILRAAFPVGAVFVAGSSEAMAAGVREMCQDVSRYEREAGELRDRKQRNWAVVKGQLNQLIGHV